MTVKQPMADSLLLALEPRMMFDAALAATANELASPDAATDAGVITADSSATAIAVDKNGSAPDVDIFKNVSVQTPEGKEYDELTVSVTGAGGGSILVNGARITLEQGGSHSFEGGTMDGLAVSVSKVNDTRYSVKIQVTGLDAAKVKSIVDSIGLDVDGTQQKESTVKVSIDSVKYLDESTDDLSVSNSLTVTSQYNFAPDVTLDADFSIADQLLLSGFSDPAQIVTATKGGIVFARDTDGHVGVFALSGGKLSQTGTVDFSSVADFGSAKSIATDATGSRLFVSDGNRLYTFNVDANTRAVTYSGQSVETGSGDYPVDATDDGKFVLIANGSPKIVVFKVGSNGSLEQTAQVEYGNNRSFFVAGNVLYDIDWFWLSPNIHPYEIQSDGTLKDLEMFTGDFGDFSAPKGWTASSDGSMMFFLSSEGTLWTFARQSGGYIEGAQTELEDVIDMAASADGKTLYTIKEDGTFTQYSVASSGVLTKVAEKTGLGTLSKLTLSENGELYIYGDKLIRLSTEKYATAGSAIDFTSALTVKDTEMDRQGSYEKAVWTVKSSETGGTYRFVSDALTLKGSTISSGDKTIATVTSANGVLTLTFAANTTTAEVQATVQAWRYVAGTGATSITLSMTLSDGEKTSSTETLTLNVTTNTEPVVTTSGEGTATVTTADKAISVFNSVAINAGETGQLIDRVVINVGNLTDLDPREVLIVDGVEIALNATSQGKTSSGLTYRYTVNADNTASLVLESANGISVSDAGNLLSGVQYRNSSVAGQTTLGLSGTRTFTIAEVRDNGGTAGNGDDTANPNITTTITLDMNTTPNLVIDGAFNATAFALKGELSETTGDYTNVVKFSPDGKMAITVGSSGGYNGSSGTSTLFVYQRDPETGEMKFVEKFSQSEDTPWLQRISAVAFSPDGKSVWVAGYDTDANQYSLVKFSRTDDGGFYYEGKVATQGEDGVAGLDGWVSDIVVSADGKTLYTINGTNALGAAAKSAIGVFSIDDYGYLTFEQVIDSADINKPSALEITKDGTQVFVANRSEKSISVFSRDSDTGKLTFVNKITTGASLYDIEISADGSKIYALTTGVKVEVYFKEGSDYVLKHTTAALSGFAAIQAHIQLSPDESTVYFGGYQVREVIYLSVGEDGTLTKSGSVASSQYIHSSNLDISPDGKTLLWGGLYVGQGVSVAQVGAVSYYTGEGASIGSSLTVSDAEDDLSNDYKGVSLTVVRSGEANAKDTYNLTGDYRVENGKVYEGSTAIADWTVENGKLTLTFSSTIAAAKAKDVMRHVLYSNEDMGQDMVKLSISVSDGEKSTEGALFVKMADVSIDNPGEKTVPYNETDGAQILPKVTTRFSDSLDVTTLSWELKSTDSTATYSLKDGDYTLSGTEVQKNGVKIADWTSENGVLTLKFVADTTQETVSEVFQNVVYKTTAGGSADFDMSVKDSQDRTLFTLEKAVNVFVNLAPEWTQGDDYSVEVYPGLDVTLRLPVDIFKDPEGGTLTLEMTGLPEGLTFDAKTMSIKGTAPTTEGEVTLTLKATDPYGATSEHTFTLDISSTANRPPVVVDAFTPDTARAGTAVNTNWSGLFSDPDGDALTLTATDLPEGLTLSEAGVLSGTPTQSGEFTVTVTAKDAKGLEVTTTVKLVVENDPPVLNDAAQLPAMAGREAVDFDLTSIFTDPEGHTIPTFEVTDLPPGISVVDGHLQGTPAASGTFTVTIVAVDQYGAKSEPATFTVEIANDAPEFNTEHANLTIAAGEQNLPIAEPVAVPADLFTDDFDGLTVQPTAVTDASGKTVSLADLGLTWNAESKSFSGTPKLAGTFTIAFTATDASGETATGTVKLSVVANQAPVVSDDITVPKALFGENVSVPMKDWIKDPSGEELTYSLEGTLPSGMSFDPATGTLSGTALELGNYKLTLVANDGTNDPVRYTFTFTVRGNNAPVVNKTVELPTIIVDRETSFSAKDFFKDPDGDEFTVTLDSAPEGFSYNADTGLIFGKGTIKEVTSDENGGSDDNTGTDDEEKETVNPRELKFTLTATDSHGLSTTYTFTVIMRDNSAPVANTDAIDFGVESQFSTPLAPLFTDAEGDKVTVKLLNPEVLPEGVSFDEATGTLSGQVDTETSFKLSIEATDEFGESTIREINVLLRVPSVSSADPSLWPEDFGQGLEDLRDGDFPSDIERQQFHPLVLRVDVAAFTPLFGVGNIVEFKSADFTPRMTDAEGLFEMLRVNDKARETELNQRRDRALEMRVERAIETMLPESKPATPATAAETDVAAPQVAEAVDAELQALLEEVGLEGVTTGRAPTGATSLSEQLARETLFTSTPLMGKVSTKAS